MFALKCIAVLAAAAVCAAADVNSPQVKTNDGNLLFRVPRAKDLRAERSVEQSASLFAVMQQVDELAQKAKVTDALLTTLPYVGSSIKRIDTLVQDTADVKASFKTINEKMAQVAKDSKAASATQTDTLNKNIAALKSTNEKMATKIASDQKTFQDAVDKSVKDKLAAMTKDADAKNAKLAKDTAAAIAKASSSVSPMWVGGHVGSHLRGGWLNMGRLDYTNAPNHLKRNSHWIEVLHTGIYNMRMTGIAHGGWCHQHWKWQVGGKWITDSSHHYIPGTWQHVELEETFVVKKGQKIGLHVNSCGHAALHGSNQNNPQVYNRITIKFEGDVGDKCTGPFCKGLN
jgi:hypothetical protein